MVGISNSFDDKDAIDLFQALEVGNIEKFKEILTRRPELINIENENNQTPFWMACYHFQENFVDFALNGPSKDVVDIFKKDRWLRSPLDAALSYCDSPSERGEFENNLIALYEERLDQKWGLKTNERTCDKS